MRGLVARWLVVFLCCLAAQGTVAATIAIFDVRPDFVFIALFVFALKYGVLPSIFVGFGVGLCQDLFSPAILGQNALCKTVAGAFAGIFNERMMSTDPFVKIALLLVSFLVHDLIFYTVEVLKTDASWVVVFSQVLSATFPRVIYSSAFASVYYVWQQYRSPTIRA